MTRKSNLEADVTEPMRETIFFFLHGGGDRFVATRGRGGALKINGAPFSLSLGKRGVDHKHTYSLTRENLVERTSEFHLQFCLSGEILRSGSSAKVMYSTYTHNG